MYGPNEEMLKKMASAECGTASCLDAGANTCAAPSLAERIRDQRQHAQTESNRLQKLTELQLLLAKNPEIARILDLLEWLKY